MKSIPIRKLSSAKQEPLPDEGFKIRQFQDIVLAEPEKGIIHNLHRHDFFFILALQKGKGIHEIDFVPYKVLDNSVFFMRPGQAHKLNLKTGCIGFLMEFSPEFYKPDDKLSLQRLRKASNKTYCKPDINRFNKLQAILSSIFHEYTHKEEDYQDAIKASLNLFFIELIRQNPNATDQSAASNPYTQERLEEFLELLEKHIADNKQVGQYADMLNLSPYQLNAITKEALGKTSSELIDEHILLESKRYLLATSNQIKDIAYHLGYDDVSYFIRFFKKHTGHSPEAFRHNFK